MTGLFLCCPRRGQKLPGGLTLQLTLHRLPKMRRISASLRDRLQHVVSTWIIFSLSHSRFVSIDQHLKIRKLPHKNPDSGLSGIVWRSNNTRSGWPLGNGSGVAAPSRGALTCSYLSYTELTDIWLCGPWSGATREKELKRGRLDALKLKDLKCLSADERGNKIWYIQTMEYYSAKKWNQLHVMTWMKLDNILLSEKSQSQQTMHTVWVHLHQVSRRHKSTEAVNQGLSRAGDGGGMGVITDECRLSFRGDENVLKLWR